MIFTLAGHSFQQVPGLPINSWFKILFPLFYDIFYAKKALRRHLAIVSCCYVYCLAIIVFRHCLSGLIYLASALVGKQLSGIRLFKKLLDTDILFFQIKEISMNLGRKKQSLVAVLLLGNVKFLAVTLSFDRIWILTVVRDTAQITTILLTIFSF